MAGPTTLGEALRALGDRPDRPPPHPVQHGGAGTLLSLPYPTDSGTTWQGIWIASEGVRFLGPDVPTTELSRSFHLAGVSASLADRLVTAARAYLERAESIDERLTATQIEGRDVPPAKLWRLQREVAALRSGIGRAVVVAAEVAGPSAERFPGSAAALAAVTREIDRSRTLAESVHQSVSDLILLRNAE
ncbi:MAG TPA: hypothetical protein VJQ43_04870, partial [Thermoplasmata archaeon]|nr:hypothetical protein [Thermoplasmata archaeon]